VKARAIDPEAANGRGCRRPSDEDVRSAHPAHQAPSRGREGAGRYSSVDAQKLYSQTMRRLRVCIGLLSALALASVAHAVTNGLSAGLVLAMALTALLLTASLGLWRVASRHQPGEVSSRGAGAEREEGEHPARPPFA
jgi:hypothetical protein